MCRFRPCVEALEARTVPTVTPTITSLGLSSDPEGLTPSISLPVTGTDFLSGSVVFWNNTALTTQPVINDASMLIATVPASLLAEETTASITVSNSDGVSNAETFTVTETGLNLLSTQAVHVVEGGSTGTVTLATFNDPAGAEALAEYSATIDWGDGSPVEAGVLALGNDGQTFSVNGGPHTYVEEGVRGGSEDGLDELTVTIAHGGWSRQLGLIAVIHDQTFVPAPVSLITATEQAACTSAVATFTDPGGPEPNASDPGPISSHYSANIDWGDNTNPSAGVISLGSDGQTFTVSGTHTYAEEGNYSVTAYIIDETGFLNASVTSSAVVADAAAHATGGFTVNASEGTDSGYQQVATFTDPAGAEGGVNFPPTDYSSTVDWGDNTAPTTGSINLNADGTFTVYGKHTYATDGNYTVTVTIAHEGAPSATATSTAIVQELAILPQPFGGSLFATEGTDSGPGPLGAFTDPAGPESLSKYAATISWGDGASSAGTITFDPNRYLFIVLGDHTYAEESPATVVANGAVILSPYLIIIQIAHDGTTTSLPWAGGYIGDVPLSVAPVAVTGPVVGGAPFTVNVATFTDSYAQGALGEYHAAIAWGDGTTSDGVIGAGSNGGYAVSGTHTYATAGSFTAQVTIDDGPIAYPAGTVAFTVNSPLIHIGTQPRNLTVNVGTTATFRVAATSSPAPTVQWQKSTDGNTWTNVTGATGMTLALPNATLAADGSEYRALLAAKVNGSMVHAQSSPATLTVNQPPLVTTPAAILPAGPVNVGTSVTISTAASGKPAPAVQWQVKRPGAVSFVNIAGANTTSLTFSATAAENGDQFQAVFTNIAGTAATKPVTLAVAFAPVIKTQPVSKTVVPAAMVTFTAAAIASPAINQMRWEVSSDGGANWNPVAGQTSITLTLKATAALNGDQFRVVFSNSVGSTTSSAATLIVNTAPIVTANPLTQAALLGQAVTFTVAATVASGTPAPTVQWQVSSDGGLTWSNLSGQTHTALTFSATAGLDEDEYRAIFSNTGGSAVTGAAVLFVL